MDPKSSNPKFMETLVSLRGMQRRLLQKAERLGFGAQGQAWGILGDTPASFGVPAARLLGGKPHEATTHHMSAEGRFPVSSSWWPVSTRIAGRIQRPGEAKRSQQLPHCLRMS